MGKFAAMITGSAALIAASLVSAQAMPVDGGLTGSIQAVPVAYGCPPGLVPGPYGCRPYHPWLHPGYGFVGGYRVYHPWLHGGYGPRPYHPWLHRGYGPRPYHPWLHRW